MSEVVMPPAFLFNTVEATGITWVTCKGMDNCFSLKTVGGKEYRVVNFYLETFQELLANGLTWPVKISPLSDEVAVLNDERIADKHYLSDFCRVCTPMDLLTLPQRLHKFRAIKSGSSVFREVSYTDADGITQKMLTETTSIKRADS